MMDERLDEAFGAAMACLCGRSELLDGINVFPVADGDTGANLRVSLAPLRDCGGRRREIAHILYRTAAGNSGNIAVSFFSEFLLADSAATLAGRARTGRQRAWRSVAEPRHGTILDVFDHLAELLATHPIDHDHCPTILAGLRDTVVNTAELLPHLRDAGVVDAGALGMFVFFDGFFRSLCGVREEPESLFALFPGLLQIAPDFAAPADDGYCVDTLIRLREGAAIDGQLMGSLGESVVVLPEKGQVKLHVHTGDPQALREKIGMVGEIVRWADEKLADASPAKEGLQNKKQCLHIMTDGAGSISRRLAREYGITLLDSYIVAGDEVRPESLCAPDAIYQLLAAGGKVTTAQAGNMERHQLYSGICEQFGRTLYLAVGSVYTGNHATAAAWKTKASQGSLLELIDTGAASGRLAVIALLTARFARATGDAEEVINHARMLCECCQEYVFIDCLRYLVAGGRVSKTGGFFGDLLKVKPVITPTATGVKKLGVVRSREGQLRFLVAALQQQKVHEHKFLVILQYSDNRPWVAAVVRPLVEKNMPGAEIHFQPLSLTSGVHMGPGTWSVALGPGA